MTEESSDTVDEGLIVLQRILRNKSETTVEPADGTLGDYRIQRRVEPDVGSNETRTCVNGDLGDQIRSLGFETGSLHAVATGHGNGARLDVTMYVHDPEGDR